MDFIDQIKTHAKNITKIKEQIQTEEGTKNALIMPFIQILGYNVFDPNEVNPEYIADVGIKKGEKVDYALMKDGEPIILIECKPVNSNLREQQASQLYRYFSTTPAKVGILTNGLIYQFYTDIEEKNVMDIKPFLEIDLANLDEQLIEQLKKYSKHSLDLDNLYDDASRLKYTKEIIQVADKEFSNPSDDFVRFFAQKVYKKKLTQKAIDQFTTITKDSLDQFLSDKINERLKSAMQPKPAVAPNEDTISLTQTQEISPKNDGIITTEDEWEGYYFVKAMLHDIVDPSKIVMRDAKSYCAILFDDNNRKPLCRFYFDGKQKYVALFDNNERQETKEPIENITDLFKLKDRIRTVAKSYLPAQ